jgi:predicted Zn-dependent protease with MMP-like domain
MHLDRHGRGARGVPDRRRRPVDGYRLPSARRFADLVDDVLATLPPPVREALASADVVIEEVPPSGTVPVDGILPLVRVQGRARQARRVAVYRRPVEARALSRLDLADVLGEALILEAASALGLDLGDWGFDEEP